MPVCFAQQLAEARKDMSVATCMAASRARPLPQCQTQGFALMELSGGPDVEARQMPDVRWHVAGTARASLSNQ